MFVNDDVVVVEGDQMCARGRAGCQSASAHPSEDDASLITDTEVLIAAEPRGGGGGDEHMD